MRLLEAPQTWIAVAIVLVVIAVVLLLLARRARRRSLAAVPAAGTPPEGSAARASYDAATDAADPPTDPVDLRGVAPSGPGPVAGRAAAQPAAQPAPEHLMSQHPDHAVAGSTGASAVDEVAGDVPGDRTGAKDRLLAALLEDPEAAVHAAAVLERSNGSGPPGTSVASLLRAGMTPAQVASLCGVRESALAEIVARDLGLLDTRNETSDPGRAWPSLASAAGSTTPTTG